MKKPRDTLSRSAMKLLCTLLGLILAVMLAATFVFQHFLGKMTVSPGSDISSKSVLSVFSPARLTQLRSNDDNSTIGGFNSQIVNILLIGQDRREGDAHARSDSMILCTYNKENNRVTMTSFLRDLYIPIPGHGSNRINAAYSLGGSSLLTQTLEDQFNLHIDGTIEVDFAQFSGIIDALGGVEITLRPDEAALISQETGSTVSEGAQVLTGEQALVYSRIRSLDIDGDVSRTSRQRKVMQALLDSCKQLRITQLIPLFNELLPMITTDLNQGQILLLGMELLPNLSEASVISQRIPADGTFIDETIDGMSVLVADLEQNRSILRKTLLEN